MFGSPKDQNRIERLKRGLYSRKAPNLIGEQDQLLHRDQVNVAEEWQAAPGNKLDALAKKLAGPIEKTKSYTNRIFLFSALFFVFSVGLAVFVFLGGLNLVSSQNVDIKVVGPISLPAGQEAQLEVVVVNSNRADLESAILNIEYPEGIMVVNSGSDKAPAKVVNQKFDLGTIKTGNRKSQTLQVILFGEKDEVKNLKLTVEYKVKNSSATFYKEKEHQISISSSPLIVTPTYPKEINSNQDIDFSIEVASNSKETLEDFLVAINYPFGFTYKSANLPPIKGNNVWLISGLKPNEKRRIDIAGNLTGQDGEERVFNVQAGTPNEEDNKSISTLLVASKESIFIKRSTLGVDLRLGGSAGDLVYQRGDVNGNLALTNNLPDKIFNTSVEVHLSGSGFSDQNVRANQGGFYRSLDKVIFWDNRTVEPFRQLDPGEKTELSFSFTPLSFSDLPKGSNPEVTIDVVAKGERILPNGDVEKVESHDTKKVKFATNITLSQRAVRSQGSLENSGPVPPKVNRETTYTIIWSMSSSWNTASSVQAKAVLPSYVKWSGNFSPSTESIIYNPATNEVVWNVSQIAGGTGFSSSPREAMFQVVLTPSSSQLGSEPQLVGKVNITGIDKATGAKLDNSAPEATTKFASDPTYKFGYEKVVQ